MKIIKAVSPLQITMKTLIVLFALSTQSVRAEGFQSSTDVTSENCFQLKHHRLKVECLSSQGTTSIALTIYPDKDNPFRSCDVIVYDKSGKERLLQFTPKSVTDEKEGLTHLCIFAADDLVDDIEVIYSLDPDGRLIHFFNIRKGWLKKVAAAEVIKDGRVVAPVFSKRRIKTGEKPSTPQK